ncbi:CdaR family protein [Haliangium sp.]|uniref:CdaR family protein n=1 Tax=Haliangium sp. TaxID=2663208 RepID=UPI003D0FD41C
MFLQNALLKLVSLVLAVALFFLVNTDRDAIIGVNVRVSYQLPEDRVLVSDPVDQIQVTIRGPWRRINRFDEREIERVTVDLTNMQNGPYAFPPDAVRLPEDLSLLSIDPATVNIAFERRRQKTVPVKVNTAGAPARGYRVDSVRAKPSQVTIRGAESRVLATQQVLTRELRLDGRSASFVEVLPLEPPQTTPRGLVEIADRTPVEVDVVLAPEMSSRSFSAVPVQVVAAEGVDDAVARRFATQPKVVDVVLHGPLLVVESFEEAGVVAEVRVRSDDLGGRPQEAEVTVRGLPAGVGTEIKPSAVTLQPAR